MRLGVGRLLLAIASVVVRMSGDHSGGQYPRPWHSWRAQRLHFTDLASFGPRRAVRISASPSPARAGRYACSAQAGRHVSA